MAPRRDKAKLLRKLAARPDLDAEERAVLEEAAELFASRAAAGAKGDSGRSGAEPARRAPRRAAGAKARSAILWSDGAARGNPGPAGIGAVLEDGAGTRLAEHSEYLGHTTNNVAEYKALLAGLARAAELGVKEIEVRADSELMIRQLKGEYRVKNAGLKPLYEEAMRLLSGFDEAKLVHVRREFNAEADRLANEGIDSR